MSMAAVPHKLDSRYLEALGPLRPLVDDDSLTEIMVNGPEMVYVERKGKILLTDIRFDDEAHLMRVIDTIVAAGRPPDRRAHPAGGRAPAGRLPRQRGDSPGRTRRPDAHDSEVQQGSVPGRRTSSDSAPDRRSRRRSSRPASWPARTSSSRAAPAPARRRCSTSARASSRSTSASSPSRTRPSCSCTRNTCAAWKSRPADVNGEGRIAIRDLVINCAAHAARPHRRRRVPWWRSAGHAPGDEHRPRRLADHHPRQQPARDALAARDAGADGRAWTFR